MIIDNRYYRIKSIFGYRLRALLSPDTLTFSEKTITYRLTLRTFMGGASRDTLLFLELVIFRVGPVK